VTDARGGPAGRPSPALTPEELQRLVKVDVLVAGIGTAAAIVALAVLVVGRLDLVSATAAATVAVAIAAVVGAACFFQFGSGPRELWRDRLLVIAPVFLVAAPGIVGLNDLGAGPIVAILSGAAGFGAAIVLGAAFAARRR
jgi:hypothetical protein